MFHYTCNYGRREGEWPVICYACLPRMRSAGYDVKQHAGRKDAKCALCGESTVPPTHGNRSPSPPGTHAILFEGRTAA